VLLHFRGYSPLLVLPTQWARREKPLALQGLDGLKRNARVCTYRKVEMLLAFHDVVFPSVKNSLRRCCQPSGKFFLYAGGNIHAGEHPAMGVLDVAEPHIRSNIFAGPSLYIL